MSPQQVEQGDIVVITNPHHESRGLNGKVSYADETSVVISVTGTRILLTVLPTDVTVIEKKAQ